MKNVDDLIINLHRTHLDNLTMYRFVITNEFIEAYNNATNEDKEIACAIIERMDKEQLIIWVKRQLKACAKYHLMSISDLRLLARGKRIEAYSTITKDQLVYELEKHDRKENKSANRSNGTTSSSDQANATSDRKANENAG